MLISINLQMVVSNYNVTKTSTAFYAYHREDDTDTALAYYAGEDLAQVTAFNLYLMYGNADDEQCMRRTYII